MSYLLAESLVKKYQGRAVVNGISMHVEKGEVVGLLGPNGAGKTTSFYMITGLIPVDDGTIRIGGQDVTDRPMHIRARHGLGYLAQETSVFRKLSVADNVLAILELQKNLSRQQRLQQCYDLLEELSIGHLRDNMAISLSGGERRRLEIARALATRPKIMLLDEPFAGVDPISVADIQAIILQLAARNIAVLITDHNVRETLGICQRAYIVSEGAILSQGSPDQIMNDQDVKDIYLGKDFTL
jgi:lipopolysaccharide export system ATP-binding protein